MAKNPKLRNKEIEDILLDTAQDLEDEGWDLNSGAGLLDAYASLKRNPKNILTLRPTEVIVNRDGKEVVSIDLFGILRGPLSSYIVELGKGENPTKWQKISESKTSNEYGLIGRIDGKLLAGEEDWIVRIRAKAKNGKSKIAHLPLDLDN